MAQPTTANYRPGTTQAPKGQQRGGGREKETPTRVVERAKHMAARNPRTSTRLDDQLVHLPRSLFLAPPPVATNTSQDVTSMVRRPVRMSHGSGSVGQGARLGSPGRNSSSPVARLEMTQQETGSKGNKTIPRTDSIIAAASLTPGTSAKRGSSRVSFTNWSARSKLPFHMLPFEVQAYHLQQQQQQQQQQQRQRLRQRHQQHQQQQEQNQQNHHRQSPDQHYDGIDCKNNTTDNTEPGTDSSPLVFTSTELTLLSNETTAAAVESAWFPLMPPAMAGEACPPAPTCQLNNRRTPGSTSTTTSSSGVFGPPSYDCEQIFFDSSDAPADARGGQQQQQQQGLERCWSTMTGNVVHLAASLDTRRTLFPSTATATAASWFSSSSSSWDPVTSAPTSCASSGAASDGDEGGEARRSSPSRWEGKSPAMPVASSLSRSTTSSPAAARAAAAELTTATSTSVAATTTTEEREAAAAAAAVKAMALAVHPQHPAAGLVFGTALDDEGAGAHPQIGGTTMDRALAVVALSGFVEGGGAARFQEVSVCLSNACRSRASWCLRITGRIDQDGDEGEQPLPPPQLVAHLWPLPTSPEQSAQDWRGAGSAASGAENGSHVARTTATIGGKISSSNSSSRLLPRRLITHVVLERDVRGVTLASWPSTMKRLEFGAFFNSPIEGVNLPEGLEVLRFGVCFNQPVSRVRWPSSLRELTFGNDFNQPVSGMDLPDGLRRLDFGGRFNFAISAMDLPEELRELRFGHGFNREIANMRWPPRLGKLEFSGELQQRVEDVAWPPTLTHLALLGDFDQPIDAVEWPSGLIAVRFGDSFRQPVAGDVIRWPPGLERIIVGRGYDTALCGRAPLFPCLQESAQPESSVLRRFDSGLGLEGCRMERVVAVPGFDPSCEVMRVVDTRSKDGDDCTGAGCCAMTPVRDASSTMRQADDEEDSPPGDGHAGERVVNATAEVDGLHLSGIDADDEGYSCWDDEDEGDWEEEEVVVDGGLTCVDVFGFEDGAWDMGDPWEPDNCSVGLSSSDGESFKCA